MQVNPYLSFNGQCAEAFRFYQRALGGTIEMLMSVGQSPMADQAPPEHKDRIMHASMRIGDTQIMGGDGPPSSFRPMQGFCVNLAIADPAEAERVFAVLAEGGQVGMPIAETFWAKRFGMVTDRFGTPWMVNCSKPM